MAGPNVQIQSWKACDACKVNRVTGTWQTVHQTDCKQLAAWALPTPRCEAKAAAANRKSNLADPQSHNIPGNCAQLHMPLQARSKLK
jgi:hypothetical protein